MNKQSTPRLKSVRMKNGGASITVLRNQGDPLSRKVADFIQESSSNLGEVVGHVVFLFDKNFDSAVMWDAGHALPGFAFPDWVASEMKRGMLSKNTD